MAGDTHDSSDAGAEGVADVRHAIPLHRAVAVVTPESIAVRQTRAGLIGPLIELVITALAVWAIVRFMGSWPLGVLFVLALVVTVLGPNNPRDRSHYEKFRSYHERLYSQVEPTSVTPFSPPVLERALHAAMAVYVRQYGSAEIQSNPLPVPETMLDDLWELLEKRVKLIDEKELPALRATFEKRRGEWRRWARTAWEARTAGGDVPLLTAAGSYLPAEDWNFTWATPLSMRNVDAECRADISRAYLAYNGDANGE